MWTKQSCGFFCVSAVGRSYLAGRTVLSDQGRSYTSQWQGGTVRLLHRSNAERSPSQSNRWDILKEWKMGERFSLSFSKVTKLCFSLPLPVWLQLTSLSPPPTSTCQLHLPPSPQTSIKHRYFFHVRLTFHWSDRTRSARFNLPQITNQVSRLTGAAVCTYETRRAVAGAGPEVAAAAVEAAAPGLTSRPEGPRPAPWGSQSDTNRWDQQVRPAGETRCVTVCSVQLSTSTHAVGSLVHSSQACSYIPPSLGGTVPGQLNTGTAGCSSHQTCQQDML